MGIGKVTKTSPCPSLLRRGFMYLPNFIALSPFAEEERRGMNALRKGLTEG
jgi:hypothetical protein